VRLNILKLHKPVGPRTHEGARAKVITPEQMLRPLRDLLHVVGGEFYEDGVQIAGRIHDLVRWLPRKRLPRSPSKPASRMKLRHAPLCCARDGAPRNPSRPGGRDPGPRHPARRRVERVCRHLLGRRTSAASAQVRRDWLPHSAIRRVRAGQGTIAPALFVCATCFSSRTRAGG